jgi:hypothetical protein
MRLEPRDDADEVDSDRVIYLGDVRRKRAAPDLAPDRHYLFALSAISLVAFGTWLTVLLTLPPQKLISYTVFFLPMWVTIGSVAAIGAYGLDKRLGRVPSLVVCLRRGGLVATSVVVNLALLAAHHWDVFILTGSLMVLAIALFISDLRREVRVPQTRTRKRR